MIGVAIIVPEGVNGIENVGLDAPGAVYNKAGILA